MERVQALVRKTLEDVLGRQMDDIAPDSELSEYGLDSISVVQVVVCLENKFKTRLHESALTMENFRSVQSIANLVGNVLPAEWSAC